MYELLPVDLAQITPLRRLHALQLHGPSDPYQDAEIRQQGALCLAMAAPAGIVGYACFSPEVYDARRLLEIYVEPGFRRQAAAFLKDVIAWVPPSYWEVSSYDRFALSLAMNAGYQLKTISAVLFSWDGVADTTFEPGYRFDTPRTEDLEAMQPLLMQDDFYTEDPMLLPIAVSRGLWRLLRNQEGQIVAAGYYEPIPRTPWYADVGMVVSRAWRGRGLGSALVKALARVAADHDYVPVAICAGTNKSARLALQRAGYYAEGRVWSVKLQ